MSATYNGDALNTPSTSSTVTETVNGVAVAATTTQIASSVNPITVGSPVTFTATVGANNGTVPGGTVTFVDTSSPAQLGASTLVNGQAHFTTSNLSAGQHPVYAAYNGDSAHGQSKSVTITEDVNGLETQTAAIASPNPVVVGQPVTFTATITGGSTAKAGTVTFQDANSALSTVAVSANQATFTTSALSVGVHAVTAVYNGDGLNRTSSGNLSETVSKEASAVQLTSSKNPVSRRTAVTFTATVTVTPATIAPTGKVTFYLGKASTGTVLASVSLSGGKSAFTTSTLPTGYDTITAVYSGDANVKSSSTQLVQRMK